jgi:hypothetical protein
VPGDKMEDLALPAARARGSRHNESEERENGDPLHPAQTYA